MGLLDVGFVSEESGAVPGRFDKVEASQFFCRTSALVGAFWRALVLFDRSH